MQPVKPTQLKDINALTDSDLVGLVKEGHAGAFRAIMQQHNRRLYRVARGILRDESEAEDAVQEAYVRALPIIRPCGATRQGSGPDSTEEYRVGA